MDIKAIVERNDTIPGRTFDLVMQALILFSIVTFTIETLPDLEADTRKFLHATEVVVVIKEPLLIRHNDIIQPTDF
ncbi:MAG: hypothetical protein OXS28_07555, partial [Gammaproteobacteria bacterium]|nr:hypothetical protein [Gammaproteobacteria bacterium]